LKYEWDGKNAYPLIYKAVTENPEIYNEEQVRNEMFLHLDYYPTESSGHNSEYNAWFRKRPDLIEKYCTHSTGWNPGEYAYILKEYQHAEATWKDEAKQWFAKDTPISLERGHEYAAYIINALKGGEIFGFNGNVPNTNLISNLPQGACVEVPVYVDQNGFRPVHVGPLPPQLITLVHTSSMIEEMAVEAALIGDPHLVFQACAFDPLTSAVLSLAEIRTMVNEMLQQNQQFLPQFKRFEA
jgi:alpha-galactosidase